MTPLRLLAFAALASLSLQPLAAAQAADAAHADDTADKPAAFDTVHLFSLADVRLLPGPFKHAQDLDRAYLLALDSDRLIAPFRTAAGLPPKAEKYPNWESTGLDGHTAGHVLTALAEMAADTGDAEIKKRLAYMVSEFAACQAASGDGYVGAVPDGKPFWADIRAGKIDATNFSLNGKWVPWYNLHKLFAGLRDAWLIAGNAEARDVLIRLSDWCDTLVAGLSDERMQTMLRAEQGGMNEVLADVSVITGNPKYLKLARRFSNRETLTPLLHHEDKLTGLHANTQIPKVIGFARIAELSHDRDWLGAARFFWETVVTHRSVAIGGNSVREHFQPTDDFSSMIESREGPETCNTYNMLKLSEHLFRTDPLARYADYYERALFNHILSAQNPDTGGFVYFTSMRPRHYRVYSQPQTSFWCCVGSGLESQAKHAQFIYAHRGDTLFVNLFIASELNWAGQQTRVTQETRFPDEARSRLALHLEQPKTFTLRIRHPEWVTREGFAVRVNGEDQSAATASAPSSYVSLTRTWRDGDVVEIELPMYTHLERLPDGSDYAAIVHGPIVLGAKTGTESLDGLFADDSRMGHVAPGPYLPLDGAPALVGDEANFADEIVPVPGQPLTFTARALIRPERYRDLQLVPFFRIHDARYVTYWRIATPQSYAALTAKLADEEKARLDLDARTLDRVTPGEQQPEVEHAFAGEETSTGANLGRRWRDASRWFGYQFKLAGPSPKTDSTTKDDSASASGDEQLALRVTYFGADRDRHFDIVVDDRVIATVDLAGDKQDRFVEVSYPIPAGLVREARPAGTLTVKFVAHEKSRTAGIYDLRLVRAREARINSPAR